MMKRIFAILLVSIVTYGAARQPQQADAGIEGVIVRYGTGEKMGKALVELVSLTGKGSQTTTTESDGRYYFPETVPGNYRLFARRDGYWPAEYGQRWVDGPGQVITIASGARMRDVQV